MTDPMFAWLDAPVQGLIREAAATIIMPAFQQQHGNDMICFKNDHSIVTQTDFAVQNFIQERLQPIMPGTAFLGEESTAEMNTADSGDAIWLWILDPIDGTHNFVEQKPDFGTMLSLWHAPSNRPYYGWIYMPVDDVMFSGGKDCGIFRNNRKIPQPAGVKNLDRMSALLDYNSFNPMKELIEQNIKAFESVSKSSCAAAKFAALFDGKADFAAFGRAKIWDLSAGFALLDAFGGHAECVNRSRKELFIENNPAHPSWYLAARQKENFNGIRDQVFKGAAFQP